MTTYALSSLPYFHFYTNGVKRSDIKITPSNDTKSEIRKVNKAIRKHYELIGGMPPVISIIEKHNRILEIKTVQ